ncbi:hypothetical protein ACLBXX_00415 [Microbacterium sp. C23T]
MVVDSDAAGGMAGTGVAVVAGVVVGSGVLVVGVGVGSGESVGSGEGVGVIVDVGDGVGVGVGSRVGDGDGAGESGTADERCAMPLADAGMADVKPAAPSSSIRRAIVETARGTVVRRRRLGLVRIHAIKHSCWHRESREAIGHR